MVRSLTYFWRSHLAVAAAAAVATATLAGALVVGDSVRGSLADVVRDRLGAIEHALTAERLVRDDLAAELGPGVVPALALRGSAIHGTTRARAAGVAVLGVDEAFTALFPGATLDFTRREGQVLPSVVLNAALAQELAAQVGEDVVLTVPRFPEIPRETLIGREPVEETVATLRLTVAAILPDRSLGAFSLAVGQSRPRNAFVERSRLARTLGAPGKVNAFLTPKTDGAALTAALGQALRAEDLGFTQRVAPTGEVVVETRQLLLGAGHVATLRELGAELGAPARPVLTYLAETLAAPNGRTIPYSTVAALDDLSGLTFAESAGTSREGLQEGEILLNTWAAAELGVQGGETIELTYLEVGARDQLTPRTASFRLAGVVAMTGLGADPTLTAEFPGLADADDMSGWDPPFPMDLGRIRPQDEAYWDAYRGTPKAFVAGATGRRLWASRFGEATSVRLTPPAAESAGTSAEAFPERLTRELARRLDPAAAGLVFRPVRAEGLAAATGATDFAGLFLGFSLFLIAAAALLAALLFRLGVERRGREVALLGALGFPAKTIVRRFLGEGLAVAAVGVALGLAGAVGWAALMLLALRTWWLPAVGEPLLFLHVRPASLAAGGGGALAVVALAVYLAVRRLRRASIPALLTGGAAFAEGQTNPRAGRARALAYGGGVLAVGLAVAGFTAGGAAQASLAFGAGAAALLAGLAGFTLAWRHSARQARVSASAWRWGARAAARNPGRSLAAMALVASASFLLVAVAANRGGGRVDPLDKSSGAGGFTLVAETTVPLVPDLDTVEGRAALGFSAEQEAELQGVRVVSLRVLPGEDASCLNLYRPGKPRVLGVPKALRDRGGFPFAGQEAATANPWQLLAPDPARTGAVPALGDAQSVLWILHSGLGQELAVPDDAGQPLALRFVALLSRTVFQSELLIAEEDFLRHFPQRTGYGYFLIETPAGRTSEVATVLEAALGSFGFDAVRTEERLASFHAVEETYLSTFQTLGGFGLLLGTLGLGVVLLRGVYERRGELAALRSFGFPRRALSHLILAETAYLLLTGLAVGSGAGLLAVAPHLLGHAARVPWGSLAATLGAIAAAGLAASAVAVAAVSRVPLLPALRGRG